MNLTEWSDRVIAKAQKDGCLERGLNELGGMLRFIDRNRPAVVVAPPTKEIPE